MIKFESLVKAIHQSINDAAKSVEADGVRHINKFFYEVDENGDEINGVIEEGDKNNKQIVRDFESGRKYRPKTVSMEFPTRTANGIETLSVDVPLIVLSPISTPKVTQAKFTADLEVTSDKEGNLHVGFPDNKRGLFGSGGEQKGNTQIEVTIEAAESPEGLQKVIDGYERALRAQIPG